MYQTCLFCAQSLGRNQVLEDLPIGRRVVFDSARGRLWVVCRRCERWNLVPFERRLEAIDAAEREFHHARLRYSSGEIGLAKLPEGLELVRVGRPLRPEFAAWRYGDQFGRRRRRMWLLGSAAIAGTVAVGGAPLGVAALGQPTLSVGLSLVLVGGQFALAAAATAKSLGRVVAPDGQVVIVPITSVARDARLRRGHQEELELVMQVHRPGPNGTSLLRRIWTGDEQITLKGPAALDGLQRLLPGLNNLGGSRRVITEAVDLSAGRDMPGLVDDMMQGKRFLHLARLAEPMRLAAEMVSQEQTEQAAMNGELALLERAWRQAEELAAIADGLALPPSGAATDG